MDLLGIGNTSANIRTNSQKAQEHLEKAQKEYNNAKKQYNLIPKYSSSHTSPEHSKKLKEAYALFSQAQHKLDYARKGLAAAKSRNNLKTRKAKLNTSRINEYIVVAKGDIESFEIAVREKIALGYSVQGGLSIGADNRLFQAMVKTSSKQENLLNVTNLLQME